MFARVVRAVSVALWAGAWLVAAARQPNVIVIVSDDQGYGDISCYDHPPEVHTPNLDRLAERGVRFTDGYASAYVCAPTRAGLLTGRYQQRYGFYTAGDSRAGLPLSEMTLADLLKKAGYATGAFGKWHLGIELPYHPLKRGFDEFYGFLGHGAHDYFDLKRKPEAPYNSIWRNLEIIDDAGYLTDNLAREAVSFIERHRSGPFFVYLAFNAVHWPLQAPEEDIKRFHTPDPQRNIYLAMLYRMDLAVGRVLDALERWGLEDETLVFFLSDNGGARNNHAHNGKLRDFKHSVYEGGIRVPFLVSWPGQIPQGKVVREPVICLDILPTVCAAAGIELPASRVYDGKNLLPLLQGKASGPVHEVLFWDGDENKRAVREGQWKLVEVNGRLELYNLAEDVGEQRDLAAKLPETVQRLKSRLDTWRSQMAPHRLRPGSQAQDAF